MCKLAYTHMHVCVCVCMWVYASTCTHVHACMHALIDTHTHTHMHAHAQWSMVGAEVRDSPSPVISELSNVPLLKPGVGQNTVLIASHFLPSQFIPLLLFIILPPLPPPLNKVEVGYIVCVCLPICPHDTSWTTQPSVTKVGVVVDHHEMECRAGR